MGSGGWNYISFVVYYFMSLVKLGCIGYRLEPLEKNTHPIFLFKTKIESADQLPPRL